MSAGAPVPEPVPGVGRAPPQGLGRLERRQVELDPPEAPGSCCRSTCRRPCRRSAGSDSGHRPGAAVACRCGWTSRRSSVAPFLLPHGAPRRLRTGRPGPRPPPPPPTSTPPASTDSGRQAPATSSPTAMRPAAMVRDTQDPHVVAEQADQRRSGQEGDVADRGDHADPPGRRGGSSAAALMPTGKPSAAPSPHRTPGDAPSAGRRRTRRGPARRAGEGAETRSTRHAAEAVEQGGPNQRPTVIAATNTANVERADGRRGVVAVDDRDAEPVVAGALGERHGEHEQPDEQGPRLASTRSAGGAAPGSPRRARAGPVGQEAAHGDRHGTAMTTATAARCGATPTWRATIADPTSAPATVPRLKPGVEARHDRAAQALLDLGARDVHGDVPGPVAEAP